jgi:UDP-glucose 4-epimerase
VIVRPFNAYGPRAHDRGDLAEVIPRFVIRVLNGLAPVIFGDGSNGRDFTYVTEVAHGIRLAGTCDRLLGSRVNIAYGRMVSVREVAMLVMNACGRNELAVEFAHPRPGDVHILRANTGRAAEQLGYRAKIPIEEGIRHYLHWFRSRHPDPAALVEADVENWQMPKGEVIS